MKNLSSYIICNVDCSLSLRSTGNKAANSRNIKQT